MVSMKFHTDIALKTLSVKGFSIPKDSLKISAFLKPLLLKGYKITKNWIAIHLLSVWNFIQNDPFCMKFHTSSMKFHTSSMKFHTDIALKTLSVKGFSIPKDSLKDSLKDKP